MISFIEIDNINDLRKCIEIAFDGDHDLINIFHIKTGELKQCVHDTWERIKGVYQLYPDNVCLYKIQFGEKEIGYTVLVKDGRLKFFEGCEINLFSFGINVRYRKKEILKEWMQTTFQLIGSDNISCVLWSKNTRVIKFLEKNGFTCCMNILKGTYGSEDDAKMFKK